jgi:transcriptional regulator with XRE-family HTH domain
MKRNQSIGKRLKAFRKSLNMTQPEFARTLSISVSYLSNMENGNVNTSFEFIMKLTGSYDIDLNLLLLGKSFENRESIKGKRNIDVNKLDIISTEEEFQYFFSHSPPFHSMVMATSAKYLFENKEFVLKSLKKARSKKNKLK